MESKKSFTDQVLEINLVTKDNEFARSIFLNDFFTNLSENVQKDFKKLLSKFHFTQRQKQGWTCEHEGCTLQSCYSHEISENVFLKQIADREAQVVIFKRDVRHNPAFFIESRVHKRDASNFPGYCSAHDATLFKDIENGEPALTDYFVNKQCLRTTRRERFEIEAQILTANDFIQSIPNELAKIEEINTAVGRIKDKISNLQKRLDRVIKLYTQIQNGITNENYVVRYNEINVSKTGYFFSTMADLSIDEDSQPCILFLYKLDFGDHARVLVCALENEISSAAAQELGSELSETFLEAIYDRKQRLLFSQTFMDSMSDNAKQILRRDSELYELTAVDRLILSNELL